MFCLFVLVRLGTTPEMPAQSCKEIKRSEGEEFSISGYYWFEIFRRGEPVQVFCDMETEGRYHLKMVYIKSARVQDK